MFRPRTSIPRRGPAPYDARLFGSPVNSGMECLEKLEADPAAEARWAALHAASASDNIFLTRPWLARWWEVYGRGRGCHVLLAADGAEPYAILPLVMERARGGVRRLSFMGSGEVAPNHLDIIAAPQDRERAAAAFADHLWRTRSQWDVLDLVSVADDSPLRSALVERLRGLGCETRVSLYTRCLHAALPATFEEFVQSRGQQTRAEYRRKCRKLLRDEADVRFGRVTGTDDFPQIFDALVRLHQERWTQLGERGIFASPPFTAFHRAAALDALGHGQLRLYFLKIGPELAATMYCFRFGRNVYYYAGGFDDRFRRHSVGIQLLGHVIEQSIQEGATEFDFLQGDEEYKEHWSTGHRDNWRVTIAAPHWRGRLAGWSASAGETLHGLWRKHVPMNTRRAVKKLLRGGPSGVGP